jgi:hypothetical protein
MLIQRDILLHIAQAVTLTLFLRTVPPVRKCQVVIPIVTVVINFVVVCDGDNFWVLVFVRSTPKRTYTIRLYSVMVPLRAGLLVWMSNTKGIRTTKILLEPLYSMSVNSCIEIWRHTVARQGQPWNLKGWGLGWGFVGPQGQKLIVCGQRYWVLRR